VAGALGQDFSWRTNAPNIWIKIWWTYILAVAVVCIVIWGAIKIAFKFTVAVVVALICRAVIGLFLGDD
jgi:Mg2+/citrate symporter